MKLQIKFLIVFTFFTFAYGNNESIEQPVEDLADDIGNENNSQIEDKLEVNNEIEIKEENNVLVLTTKNFDNAINTNTYLLVEFYAPWCGHCKKLTPEYSKAATILLEKQSNIKLSKVDVTTQKELAKKYNVKGYPTLKLFINGNDSFEYNGNRTAEDIVSWLENTSTMTLYKIIDSIKQFDEELASKENLVMFFGKEEGVKFEIFRELSKEYEIPPFYLSYNKELIEREQVMENDLVIYKQYDENKIIYDRSKEFNEEVLIEFIENSVLDYVSEFDETTADQLFVKAKPGIFLFRNSKIPNLEEIFKKVAPEYNKNVLFISTDISEGIPKKFAEYSNIKEKDLPLVRIYKLMIKEKDLSRYTLKEEITEDSVRTFINEYLNGTLTPDVVSEEISYDQKTAVIKVVAKNFGDIVYDQSKDVVLTFYGTPCENCNELEEKIERLANDLKKYDSLVFAKMNSDLNEVFGQPIINSFPTVKFYSHKNKSTKIIDIENPFEEGSILEFLKKQDLIEKIEDSNNDDVVVKEEKKIEINENKINDDL